MRNLVLTALITTLLTACVGRGASPIPVFKSSDIGITCNQIERELNQYRQKLVDLQKERSDITRYNVKVGLWTFFPLFFLIPVHLVFINTTDAPELEQYAIGGRMNTLTDLKKSKSCGQ